MQGACGQDGVNIVKVERPVCNALETVLRAEGRQHHVVNDRVVGEIECIQQTGAQDMFSDKDAGRGDGSCTPEETVRVFPTIETNNDPVTALKSSVSSPPVAVSRTVSFPNPFVKR